MSRRTQPFESRFWPKVDKSGECWLWTGATTAGYGYTTLNGKQVGVHRVAYEKFIGPIPDGYSIDHICHVRNCLYPAHLRAVTNKQNSENRQGARSDSKSGVQGVSWSARKKKWRVVVTNSGIRSHGGDYESLAEAEAAAIALRNELFTHNDADRMAS